MASREEEGLRRLAEMDESATAAFLLRGNVAFLECAISLLVTSVGLRETANILEREAELLLEEE